MQEFLQPLPTGFRPSPVQKEQLTASLSLHGADSMLGQPPTEFNIQDADNTSARLGTLTGYDDAEADLDTVLESIYASVIGLDPADIILEAKLDDNDPLHIDGEPLVYSECRV